MTARVSFLVNMTIKEIHILYTKRWLFFKVAKLLSDELTDGVNSSYRSNLNVLLRLRGR